MKTFNYTDNINCHTNYIYWYDSYMRNFMMYYPPKNKVI